MPIKPNARALWDGKRTGSADDARRRQEIEARIKAHKPLRQVDKIFLRERLGMTTWIRDGKDVLT